MAVTALLSTQLANAAAVPNVKNETNVEKGKIHVCYFSFTQVGAGDTLSTAELVKLPAGRVRVLRSGFHIANSAFGASRTLDIGTRAYTKFDGTTQAEAGQAFKAALDVSSAAINTLPAAAGADPTLYLESATGVTLFAKLAAGATIPDAATLIGYVTYVTD